MFHSLKADNDVICQCGCIVKKYYMLKHLQTAKHDTYVNVYICIRVCIYACMYVCISLSLSRSRARALSLSLTHTHTQVGSGNKRVALLPSEPDKTEKGPFAPPRRFPGILFQLK